MRQTLDFGFQGGVFPDNPKRDLIFGRDCFASVLQLPVVPDHVGIILPAAAVPQTLEQCAERGVPFVTIFTSGFAETGEAEGCALQQRAMDIARAGNIRMMGPNCNGMVNFVDAFALTSTATISGPRAAPGAHAISSALLRETCLLRYWTAGPVTWKSAPSASRCASRGKAPGSSPGSMTR